MSIKLVAEVPPLHSRHIIVLANRQRKSTSALVSQAVAEFLDRNPVEGIESAPLHDLMPNKAAALPTLKHDDEYTPRYRAADAFVPTDVQERVALSTTRPKAKPEPIPGTPKKYKESKRVTQINGVKITHRILRGPPQLDHINDSVRLNPKAATPANLLQAALSQRKGNAFYVCDLFIPVLWDSMSMVKQRAFNAQVRELLAENGCFADLGLNTSKRHSYVYIGAQKEAKK